MTPADEAPGIFAKALAAHPTPIPGVVVFDLPVHGDNRGWFKENWQRSKMAALGLPDFGPVQNNISFNETAGTTRGIHAEPWDKYISVATGRVFGAWVDLREGPTFGRTFHHVLDPSQAIFIPRGVGNAFQTLEDGTAYTYLVNDHWSADAQEKYTFLNLADPTAAIPWPIPLDSAETSAKDKAHPFLPEVAPMPAKRVLVLGAGGQLGTALRFLFADRGDTVFAARADFDLADPAAYDAVRWQDYEVVINAAAYTAVDAAETPSGRRDAWNINTSAVSRLARIAAEHRITLVHVSTDYVFDGTSANYREDDQVCPLGVYGQTKAAGDAAAATAPRHYIIRTSWVIGEGHNFVRTMASLASKGVAPSVVNDQIGRLTFAEDIAAGIRHLLDTRAPFGTYNLTNDGEPGSWADVAAAVYRLAGADPAAVTGVSTEEYFASKPDAAPRPRNSVLDLAKIKATGFSPRDAGQALAAYLNGE
ncbi:dTDP-4-dehydrorhamnose reductase [Arthrobacter sp. zg-Y859]|uniref:dTDP-4-dehydrorhamnose reductase n=1 Tax=Arthrobacter jinronghuae TaxID=2964609 RepID=A0ABT1NPC8_9MICC|nr:dTDP-4-dehydrorhamnose reductase [Arthrobacter jinronghuae]MCQ1949500.1 dTDP-4-dehydrorhamnose reductase [Arthrobacter jinronghuae]UWX77729.1 dTDP-4-dehydrorhamnose reductase [Arthrobacter jinronghuae]